MISETTMTPKKIIPLIVTLSLLGFLVWNILQNLPLLSSIRWHFSFLDLLILILFLLPIHFINGYSWHIIVKSIGGKVRLFEDLKVWVFSSLSRLIPGGLWQYPARVLLLSKNGPSKTVASEAVIIDALMNLYIGSFIVLISIFWIKLTIIETFGKLVLVISLILTFLVVIFASSRMLTKLVNLYTKTTGRNITVTNLKVKYLPLICLLFFGQFFFSGMVLFYLSRGFVDLNLANIPLFVSIFTISWLIGFLSLFAPGGLGVQEISIATLLSTSVHISFPLASLIAVLFRILLYICEFFTLLVFIVLKEKFRKN